MLEGGALAGQVWERGFAVGAALRWRRIGWVAGVLALYVAGLGVMYAQALSDPYYRFDVVSIWLWPLCWTAGLVLYGSFARSLVRRTWVWVVGAVPLAGVTISLWALMLIASALMSDDSKVRAVQVSGDGRHELVTEYFTNMIDPSCRVWLRERDGLFARRTLVWERIEANCPARVAFADGNTIAITEREGRAPLSTTFDPERMVVAERLPVSGR